MKAGKNRALFLLLVVLCLGRAPSSAHEAHKHAQPKVERIQPVEAKPEMHVLKAVADYRAALEARSVEKLEAIVDPGLLVLEGIHKNVGWADYRDNHIGPEMKEWTGFKVQDPKVLEVAVHGDLAYVVQEATVTISLPEKNVVLASAETIVLKKGPAGWKIKHVHLSSKRLESPGLKH